MPTEGSELDAHSWAVKEAAEKALRRIMRAITNSPIREPAYAIKSRIKTKQDVYDKVLRKRKGNRKEKPKPDYEPESMTDVAGVRIVTLFQPDIVSVVSHLIKMVQRHETTPESPIDKDGLKEVLIFTNRPDNDPLAVAQSVFQIVNDAGYSSVCKPPQASESGYSSVHLIVTTSVDVDSGGNQVTRKPFPVEIQIRTVFEDAWGEVDHRLRYRNARKPIEEDDGDERLETWKPHLNALKTYVDGCSQYADIIKMQAIDTSASNVAEPRFKPIETVQQALAVFSAHPDTIKEKLRRAYFARERMINAERGEQKFQAAVETIEEFERIEKEEHTFLSSSGPQSTTLDYFLKMEQAFASMQRRDEQGLRKAVEIYKALSSKHPNDPALYYRWGTALADLKEPERALPIMEHGVSCLGKEQEGHWLAAAIPRNVAFAYWRLSEKDSDPAGKLKLLEKAFDWAVRAQRAAQPGHPQEVQALNSAIYYVVEHAAIARATGKAPIANPTFDADLKKFVDSVHVPTSTDVRKLDTLCRAYEVFKNDHERAAEVALRILSVMDSLDATQFGPDENDMIAFARNVLKRDQGVGPSDPRPSSDG
jgi:ppGpp synthetase/RelA/SpoT-type nucleotidyltranferase